MRGDLNDLISSCHLKITKLTSDNKSATNCYINGRIFLKNDFNVVGNHFEINKSREKIFDKPLAFENTRQVVSDSVLNKYISGATVDNSGYWNYLARGLLAKGSRPHPIIFMDILSDLYCANILIV